MMCIMILILYKHRANISRLIDGKESKLNFHHKAPLHEILSETQPPQSPPKTKPAKTIKKAAGTKKPTTKKHS